MLCLIPMLAHGQVNITSWMMNADGDKPGYWAQTGTAPSPAYTWTISPDSGNVLKVCYSADSIWVRAQGLTDSMGKYKNPGYCYAQDYVYRFPRNPTVAATKTTIPKTFSIGALLNGVPIYGLSNSFSWNGTSNVPGAGGLGIWNVEVGVSEGFVLDSVMGAHPQQSGAYHSHTAPYRFFRNTPAGKHSPLIGFAFDGYPIYGPYGYVDSMDSTSGVTRMISGYSLRSITQRHALADGTILLASQYGPDVSGTYPIGYYCEDYEWLSTNGGTLDQYNGRHCVTPEYPAGTYAYFVTEDATGAAAYPYYMGIQYYGVPDIVNFSAPSLSMPTTTAGCIYPYVTAVPQTILSATDFIIFPNPSSGHINLQITPQSFTEFAIYNMTCQCVYSAAIKADNTELDLNLPTGVYVMRCTNSQTGNSTTHRFVVE